jgi:excisionase family DNA binding protein
MERWLTINEAAALVTVSRRTIYNWLTAGKLETRRTVGGAVRINPASLFGAV